MAKSYTSIHAQACNQQQYANATFISGKEQLTQMRDAVKRLEDQQRQERKAQKRAAKLAKRTQKRRAFAIEQLERLAKGSDQAAVEAARELLYMCGGNC